jgi:predicted Ser/Thr protein kinase/tetratricopeptide (TPR) repeat protein
LAQSPPQIAKYHIVRRLGHGGMGTVYLGLDPDLNRSVAIKVLREPMADEELLQRFLREARATANLRHENLITIYEVGSHDQQPFIAMEYVDGTTLGELIKRRQALPLAQKLSYIEQICAGLHHAHRVGIVHRDIKPANVMVDVQGVIRILDFGIARVANSGMTSDGALIGTLNYMSPEQMLGRPVDFRSDIFSVGALAYEMLSYHQAFPGTLDDGLLQRLPQMAPSPLAPLCPGLPPGLEEIVLRALAKPPLERFADLDEMRNAVRHLRSRVDPNLELETVVIPSRDKAKPLASSAERRGLLERRARQIAIHRDAARAALTRGDLDSAAAACDDALTLDPDDREATQILAEIQRGKEQREQESKARRERERGMRQRVADAEITLARLLEEVFSGETGDPAALALLDKVRDAATAAGVALPDTLNIVVKRARSEAIPEPTRLAQRPQLRRSRVPIYAAAGVVVLAIGAVVVWMIGGDQTAPVTETASIATGTNAPVPPSPTPAVADPGPATTGVRAPAPQPIPPVTPASAATSPSPAAVDSLAAPLARIAQLHQAGDVKGALADLARIGPSGDNRVSTLARSVAQSAFRSMDAALAAAVGQKAADLVPASYSAAEQARRLADAASSRSDFVESGTRALAASDLYRKAESDARAAMAAKPPASAAATPPANPAPVPEAPPSPRAEAPTPAPPTAPRPSALDAERPGILRALNRYQDAYRQMKVEALKNVYPSLPRETGQQLDRAFRRDCRAYDVTFLNPQLSLVADDPTAATVTVRTTYTCQPKSAQAAQPQTVQDVFQLRKISGEWLIDSAGTMDTNRSR